MRFVLAAAALITACSAVEVTTHEIAVTLTTPTPGLRVYVDGRYLGRSPVTLTRPFEIHDLGDGIRRWFVAGTEVDAGGGWRLAAETFRDGVRVPVPVVVPFDPERLEVTVELAP